MHLVQSFWSKPLLDEEGKKISNFSYSYWFNKHMFFYTHALSAILLNIFYKGQTILVTDKFGKALLVDSLGLKYDEVIVGLDVLNKYPKDLWALGKLYAYSILNKPFIHVDFDFLLTNKFSEKFENSCLVSYIHESDETRQKMYNEWLKNYLLKFSFPPIIRKYFLNYRSISYNAGVFGGNRIEIFKSLWTLSKDFIDHNINDIEKNSHEYKYSINVFLEQYLFACLAQDMNIDITCLHFNENDFPDDHPFLFKYANFPKYKSIYLPEQHIHMIAYGKSSINNAIYVSYFLRKLSPESWNMINELLENDAI